MTHNTGYDIGLLNEERILSTEGMVDNFVN